MSHKTFISYKFSEAKELRDRIIDAMGDDASYYNGETSESPDISDRKTDTIKERLKDMIFSTSVTIVILSPNMLESSWIDWEIEYSLKEITRKDRTSRPNGVLCVIQKVDGKYSWIRGSTVKKDQHTLATYDNNRLFPIICNNRYNQTPKVYSCEVCKSIDALEGSYISIVDEDTFLSDVNKYIENAFDKSKRTNSYNLCKDRKKARP